MLRRSFPLLALALLSGCALNQPEQHQKTLQAISAMEVNVNSQLLTMSDQIDQQNEHIANLEKELLSLSEGVNNAPIRTIIQPQQIEAEKPKKVVPIQMEAPNPKLAHGKAILGEEEWVWLDSVQSHFKARIDTGATTSSLNAVELQVFERNGKEWVRFNLNHQLTNVVEEPEIFEAPVLRWVKIRQSTSQEAVRRPVIEAWVQLGSLHEKAQFTLADRTQMTYPVLLGREFFKDIALVDVGKKYVQGKDEPEQLTLR
ncbi:ATP-dependent zinc protease family protein [Photobacterium swingsii]|uniref:ATP-dependent zinc protease family protein n=1 Tax=Photobacterium swingsii TaxID=680026 RepID=UPI0040679153